jgi:ABC-2 type transport system ATP-binding protein
MIPDHAIQVDGLSRRFGAVTALESVTFTVPPGTVIGILGHNGAGKTTLLEILATLLLPQSGRAEVCGHDVVAAPTQVRRVMAYAPSGGTSFFPRLTGRQNLEYFAALYNVPRREWRTRGDDAATEFAIADALDRRVDTYSDGMRQRLALARVCLARAQVWLLDEPTRGLDPHVRAVTHAAITRHARSHGATILWSTHDLSEAETMCDRVLVLHRGRVTLDQPTEVVRASPGALHRAYGDATSDGTPSGGAA